jgi:hypothetical protein
MELDFEANKPTQLVSTSLAQGWGLGPADGRSHQGAWRRGADDRQLDRAGSAARLRGQKNSGDRCVERSRGGLTTKIHARVRPPKQTAPTPDYAGTSA